MTTTQPTRIGKTTVATCVGSIFAQVRQDDRVGLVAIIAAPFSGCMAPSSFLCMVRRGRAEALTLRDLADPPKMSAVLAAQAPAWTPGTRQFINGFAHESPTP